MPFYAATFVHVFVLEVSTFAQVLVEDVSTSVHELLAPGIGCQKLGEPRFILAENPEIGRICSVVTVTFPWINCSSFPVVVTTALPETTILLKGDVNSWPVTSKIWSVDSTTSFKAVVNSSPVSSVFALG